MVEAADAAEDVATASLLEEYIDEAEKRLWFLFETNQDRASDATRRWTSYHRPRPSTDAEWVTLKRRAGLAKGR